MKENDIWWHDSEPYAGPDVHDPAAGIRIQMNILSKKFGKSFKQIEKILNEICSDVKIIQGKKQSDYVLFPSSVDSESARDKALRLKKTPHSMTVLNGFDRKGMKQ